ncbi:MAG: anaerobic ribonucleoside-triphosphate reductase activating protein [Chromatiales bacterium]|jgi:pyruvate formate lyase activating enzyme
MSHDNELNIGGFTPMTTIDYPGELAAVIFCQGCPWSCRYCHNSELIPRKAQYSISWNEIIEFLEQRRGLLDAVVFSGGEPTLQRALPKAIDQVKAMGYKVGLHTAGPYPERLQELLPRVDWVGLDIKALEEDYAKVTGVKGSGTKAWTSARLLIDSGVPHDIRTTVHPALTSNDEQQAITARLQSLGTDQHRLQECVLEHCLDPQLSASG